MALVQCVEGAEGLLLDEADCQSRVDYEDVFAGLAGSQRIPNTLRSHYSFYRTYKNHSSDLASIAVLSILVRTTSSLLPYGSCHWSAFYTGKILPPSSHWTAFLHGSVCMQV